MLKISVPATSANLGPGFDSVGVALDLYNEFYVFNKVKEKMPPDTHLLKSDSLAHQGLGLLARYVKKNIPEVEVAIKAQVPPSRGLGSSATLTVAGLTAANFLLDAKLTEQEMITLASEIEGHPDNASPALIGGVVLSMITSEGIKYQRIMPAHPLQAVVAVPDFELATAAARKVLPAQVSHKDAVYNTGRYGYFIASLLTGDYNSLDLAMEDLLHQPYRVPLVPGLNKVMQAARNSGALGSCLSGAGPTILAFCQDKSQKVSEVMQATWQEHGITSSTYLLNINAKGTTCSVIS